MRSIWNGAISFGLVSIPIKLVNATENRSVSFRQVHTEDGGRIRYRKVCELDGEEVPSAEIGKAYEEADGTMIPITDEDLASLPLPTAKTIEIVAFVPASQIDPLQMDAAYYLAANGVPAAKPYTLLREALKRSERVAIAKFALRGRERLGMLRVVDDVIAMHGLLWPDEIRHPEGVAPETSVTVREAELDLADALMDTLGEVDIETLHDDYRSAVEELIAAKAEGGWEAPRETGPEKGAQVIDLMAALESSVRAAREARGEESGTGSAGEPGPDADARPGGEGGGGESASVTELPSRRTPPRARSAPKQGGARKSTARTAKEAEEPPARKSTARTGRTAAKKATERETTGGTARKTTGKAAAKATGTAADKAGGTAAKATGGKAAAGSARKSAAGTGGKSTGKTTAKKSTTRKRSA
ncbi:MULTISPECIES: Ku protein [Streptomyces]|uniref:Non-homologous end joining protein Ku n=2 Tax=Streptomyces TaxID=1883 RepID=A0A100Y424_9ACTN|nr:MULTISPECIES: Ku protein [Streptomyces]KUH37334.1 DNA repair protein [Streptomyces kanasensis]UUS32950.1 Ku protein [Streptomyces changanensis]